MATVFPVGFVVSVDRYSDPSELRPKDDQVIVLEVKKGLPNKIYTDELNKYIHDDNSFINVSRIGNERLCVVFEKAAQAALLVEQIGCITVNEKIIPIKFFV